MPAPVGALACFLYGSLFALPVILAGIASVRAGARHLGMWAVAVISAGTCGNAVLQLHCPLTDPGHLLLGHASIGFVIAAAGAVWVVLRRS